MNPMQMLQNLIANNTNPILSNAISLAQKGDVKGVEQIARNICKERNIDYDTEFEKFKNNFTNKG